MPWVVGGEVARVPLIVEGDAVADHAGKAIDDQPDAADGYVPQRKAQEKRQGLAVQAYAPVLEYQALEEPS